MARGHIYEITDNPSAYPLGYMYADELSQFCGQEFEYTEDYKEPNPYHNTSIMDILTQHGFNPKIITNPYDNDETCICFTAIKCGKESYFKSRFETLQNLMKDMTLEDFTDSETKNTIQNLVDDQYNDAVYFNTSFYTFDAFMRDIEPGKDYYIGNICIMS